MMSRLFSCVMAAGVALSLTASQADAAFIVGSTSIDAANVVTSPTASNLATATNLTFTPTVGMNRTGYYATNLSTGGTVTTNSGGLTFSSAATGASLVTPFTLTFANGMVFTASSGVVALHNATNLVFDLVGAVSNGGAGFETTSALVSGGFSQAGGAGNIINGQFTLTSPNPNTIGTRPRPGCWRWASGRSAWPRSAASARRSRDRR